MDFFDLCSHPRAETYPYPFPKGEAAAVVSHLFGAVWFSPFWRGLLFIGCPFFSWDCSIVRGLRCSPFGKGLGVCFEKINSL